MCPSLPMNVCTRTHALTPTVGGTWRISKDAAVACVGAWLCTYKGRGKEEQKNGSITSEEGREKAEAPRKKYPSPLSFLTFPGTAALGC